MQRILFIGHEASRSGAPVLLLQFLRWLKDRDTGCEVDVLLLHGGPLEEDYRKVANVQVLPPDVRRRRRGLKRVGEKLGLLLPLPRWPDLPLDVRYDLVVGNTVMTLPHLAAFGERGFRTVSWLHELDYAVGEFSTERFVALSTQVDRFLVVSRAVADMLHRFGIRRAIDVVHGFPKPAVVDPESAAAIRDRLGIPDGAFVVGGCGTIEWRKGVDWFMQLARRLASRHDDLHFLWVGGNSPYAETEFRRIRYEFDRLGIEGRLVFAGAQANPQPFLAAMDVFALTSREDPFPLVCLEAASLGKPIVCFDKAGGMPEFVGHDAGAVVPYGDLDAFGERLLHYRRHRVDALRAGNAARAKVDTTFSMATACTKLWEALHPQPIDRATDIWC